MSKDNQKIIYDLQATFNSLKDIHDPKFKNRIKGIVRLRVEGHFSKIAKEHLKKLLSHKNIYIQILAAEALSDTRAFPNEVITCLREFLEQVMNNGYYNECNCLLIIALKSLEKYKEKAISAEKIIWNYIYAQKNHEIILKAIKIISWLSKISSASWTILCLLCRHEDQIIRDFSRNIMNSSDFKEHIVV